MEGGNFSCSVKLNIKLHDHYILKNGNGNYVWCQLSENADNPNASVEFSLLRYFHKMFYSCNINPGVILEAMCTNHQKILPTWPTWGWLPPLPRETLVLCNFYLYKLKQKPVPFIKWQFSLLNSHYDVRWGPSSLLHIMWSYYSWNEAVALWNK